MSVESLLEKYAGKVQAIKDHIEANKGVFDAHQRLVGAQIDAENDLRDEAAAVAGPATFSAEGFTLTVTPQTQEVFDEEATLSALRVTKEGAIAAGVLKVNERPAKITIREAREAV